MQKKLMILGAGPHQVAGIKKAVELGLYVISVDYLPENIGHKYSHQYVNCDVTDPAGVLRAAESLSIDGIVTFAEIATKSVAFVAERLGLPGNSTAAIELLVNKARFRSLQLENQLNSPCFVAGTRWEDVSDQVAALSPPLMFKPVDSNSSRGITWVGRFDTNRCVTAFEYARGYSRSKSVCVEEYLEGVEVGGDGFLVNGRLAFAAITHKHKNGFVPIGHSLPTNIDGKRQQKVRAELATNCRAAGYTDGPLNFDVIVSPDRVTVLEMSPRLGGNGIPFVIKRATGVDLITTTLHFAVGEAIAFPANSTLIRDCGSWVFGSKCAGHLQDIAGETALKAAVPEVFDYFSLYHTGDSVSEFIHTGNSMGYVLFDCPPQSSYDQMVERLQQALHLKVVENHNARL
jgi:biotin carboxylase